MIRDEASGCLPGLPEDITALMDRGHSKNIRFPLGGGFRECNL